MHAIHPPHGEIHALGVGDRAFRVLETIPKQLRDQVWTAWRSGEGAASVEHLDAVRLAITACQIAA